MEFRVLGPLEVMDDGRMLSIPVGKARALLIDLLLHANKAVPIDRLVEDLWPAGPPQTATTIVQLHVSRLRKALPQGRLETHQNGYLLRVEPDELDSDVARDLASRARAAEPAEAATLLRSAIGLWRGGPLHDVAYEPFAEEEVRRLEELRLSLVADRIEADLACGAHRELIGELDALVSEHPLHERLRAAQMLALYRDGRQADALAAYRDVRATLVEELGLDPSPELQDLERRILRHDPDLAAPTPSRPRPRRRRLIGAAAAATAVAAFAVGVVVASGGTSSVRLAPNSLFKLSPESGRAEAGIRVGDTPRAVVGDRDAIWTLNYGSNTVTRIPRTMRNPTTVGVAGTPTEIVDGAGAVWVLSTYQGTLVRLDRTSGETTAVVNVGRNQQVLAAEPEGIWLADEQHGTLSRVSRRTLGVRVVRTGLNGPSGLVYAAKALWVVESFRQRLLELDPRSGRTLVVIPLPFVPERIDAGAGALWITSPAANEVIRFDLGTSTLRSIAVGTNPSAIAAGPKAVWVVNDLDHSVSQLDPASGDVRRTLTLTRAVNPRPPLLTPGGIATDADGTGWLTLQQF